MNARTAPAQTTGMPNGATGVSQYVTFVCAGVEYGVEILRVQEIRGWGGVTPMPNAPGHVLGVMNIRGVVVPVINLRARFGLQTRAFDGSTVVIVVSVGQPSDEKIVGIVVDAVSEVRSVPASELKAAPELGSHVADSCVIGLATIEDKMVMLLDLEKLVGPQQPSSLVE